MPVPPRTIARAGLLAAMVALLGGCASMTEEECLSADWYERGLRDGRSGQPPDYLNEHREACSKVHVTPDAERYAQGRALGVREYCRPENGTRLGRIGATYRRACPAELEGPFLERYRPAYRVYESEQRLSNLNNEIRNKERQLESEKDEDKRRRLRRELRDLDDRVRSARDDLYQAELRLRRY